MIASAEQAGVHALMVLNSMCSLCRDRSGGASVLRWRWTIEDSKILSADGRLPADVCNRQVTTCTYTPVSASPCPEAGQLQFRQAPCKAKLGGLGSLQRPMLIMTWYKGYCCWEKCST